MTTVSVALATYNGERFVQEQIASIAAQTYAVHEIVICDDASTDSTIDCIEAARQNFSINIRVYKNPENIGFIRNFEKAISLCEGEIIVLCDQDDVWFSNKLERIIHVFSNKPDCGLVFTDAIVADQTLNSLGFTVYSRYEKPDMDQNNTLSSLIKKVGILGCTLAFRAKYLPYLLPISTMSWGHDHWIVFILAVTSHLYMIDEPLMYYRRHGQNIGDSAPFRKRIDQVMQRLYKNLSRTVYQTDYQKWAEMLRHLQSLRDKGTVHHETAVFDARLKQIQERVLFAQKRLEMQDKRRFSRIASAVKLFQNRDYQRYTPGVRTLFKDIIA
jgi:glycosyltransferase involved in cell wall biosynthesis